MRRLSSFLLSGLTWELGREYWFVEDELGTTMTPDPLRGKGFERP